MSCKPNALQKRMHRFLMSKPVSALMAKILHRADSFMLLLTGGRHTFTELAGLPIIQLKMKGAKTGKLRTLTLVGLPDHDRLALVATNFGQTQNPGWYYNLKAHPECRVEWNGKEEIFVARETNGNEYDEYWKLAVSYYEGYEEYKKRARRKIPVMVLELKKQSLDSTALHPLG